MRNATFYEVLHEENKSRKQTLESAQYGLDISFKNTLQNIILNF